MNANIEKLYAKFRKAGESASRALYAAKILNKWNDLESDGLVRIRAEAEQESYVDVYGKTEAYTDMNGRRVTEEEALKELYAILERDGCWVVFTEYMDGEEWERADSVGMCTGYSDPTSPFQNCYVPDLMSAAIEAIENLDTMPAVMI